MLRTSRASFRKNWVCQPSRWNGFFANLALDLEDLAAEIEAQTFPIDSILAATETIAITTGADGRTSHPSL